MVKKSDYLSNVIDPTKTPQVEPLPGRESEMVRNSAGGFTFSTGPWGKLRRFLILGSEGGTYYASEREITKDNTKNVIECCKANATKVAQIVLELDSANRAPKRKPLIFTLAAAHQLGDPQTRKDVQTAVLAVVRTGTDMFLYISYLKLFGGLGRSKRDTFEKWMNSRSVDQLGYTVAKYQNREGWTWQDAIRLMHPAPGSEAHQNLFRWLAKGEVNEELLPTIVLDCIKAKTADERDIIRWIEQDGLSHEMIPTEKQSNEVWATLAEFMPATALIRSLGRLGAKGLLNPLTQTAKDVEARLGNHEWLQKARVHPIQVLSALKVYEQGHGERGSLEWKVNRKIVDALDDAFYATFNTLPKTNKTYLLGVDVSGSMTVGPIAGVPGLTPRSAAAVMAMVTARTCGDYHIMGFSDKFVELKITAKSKLDEAMRVMDRLPFRSTDCSLPMQYASRNRLKVDAFGVYTDNETYAGSAHPSVALRSYRKSYVDNAKLFVVGFTATEFTIADPTDPGSLDIVGFDASAPSIITEFVG